MADVVKKASKARTPRNAALKAEPTKAASRRSVPKAAMKVEAKRTTRQKGKQATVTHEEIAILAHRLWTERGYQHGLHHEDWLRAERMLQGQVS